MYLVKSPSTRLLRIVALACRLEDQPPSDSCCHLIHWTTRQCSLALNRLEDALANRLEDQSTFPYVSLTRWRFTFTQRRLTRGTVPFFHRLLGLHSRHVY
jgi:hypothetical protein